MGAVRTAASVTAAQQEALLWACATKALGHYTHEKSPVSCAAGLATIDYILDNDLMASAEELGWPGYSKERMIEMMGKHEVIGDVRGIGLLMGIELVEDRVTKARAFDAAERVMYAALERGLSFKLTMGNIITLCPPLTVTREEMSRAFNIIEECLEEL